MKLIDIISERGIVPKLRATTRDEAIAELVDHLVDTDALEGSLRDDVMLALLKREATATTGVGAGVAIPHAPLPWLENYIGAMGLSRSGLDFFAIDGKPVHVIFLFLSPSERPKGHLDLMGRIAALCNDPGYLELLHQAQGRAELAEVIADAERLLLGEAEEHPPPEEDSGESMGV